MASSYVFPAIIALLVTIQSAMCAEPSGIPDVKTYFGEKIVYRSAITWAHRVNSKDKLEKVLGNGTIMMLEADVVMGSLKDDKNDETIPIMAHPPNNTSDLSLEQFINAVIANKTKRGIKLDFKSDEAFAESRFILENLRENITFPVMLNADILEGPGKSTNVPVAARKFLLGASSSMPNSVLSVGWTTISLGEYAPTDNYTEAHTKQMADAIKNSGIKSSVTYPVRAVLAVNSAKPLKSLLADTSANKPTLTLWMGDSDKVNATLVSNLIKEIGYDNVYVDLPEDMKSKLVLSPPKDNAAPSTLVSSAMLVGTVITSLAFAKLV